MRISLKARIRFHLALWLNKWAHRLDKWDQLVWPAECSGATVEEDRAIEAALKKWWFQP
jgi:hypothetical protein